MNFRTITGLGSIPAASLLLAMATPAAAAPFMDVNVGSGGGQQIGTCTGVSSANGAAPVAARLDCTTSGASGAVGVAHADFGHLGALSSTIATANFNGNMGASAEFRDTLRFTSDNPGALFADVSLNMLLDGTLGSGASDFSNAFASISGFLQLGDSRFTFMTMDNKGAITSSTTFIPLSGIDGNSIDTLLRTPSVRVALNQDIRFEFGIHAFTGASTTFLEPLAASGRSDFGSSFMIRPGEGAFDLPDGVTVNAGSYLVNNRYIDPLAPTGGVPEPSAWALMIAGFGLAGAALRRRIALAA